MSPRSMKKMCLHTWKLPESAWRTAMTKLPSVKCGGMLNFFQNGPIFMFTRFFEIPTLDLSILSITWTCCIVINWGSRTHYLPQFFSKSVSYQTWSDAIILAQILYCYAWKKNNIPVFLTRKPVSQVYFLQS